MLNPSNMFRMLIEMIFVLLGGFLAWIGLSGRFLFDPRQPGWLFLGAVLVYWGARSLIRRMRGARKMDRMVTRLGGASLVVVGFLMLGLAFVEFRWVGAVLAAAGGILILRGLSGAVLSLWPR